MSSAPVTPACAPPEHRLDGCDETADERADRTLNEAPPELRVVPTGMPTLGPVAALAPVAPHRALFRRREKQMVLAVVFDAVRDVTASSIVGVAAGVTLSILWIFIAGGRRRGQVRA